MSKQANALLIILISFLLAYWIRFGDFQVPQHYLIAILVTLVFSSIVLPATGAFRPEFEWAFMRRVRRLIAGWAVVILALVSVAAMLKTTDYYSRIWFGVWVLISSGGLVLTTLVLHYIAVQKRNRSRQNRKIVLVGAGMAAARAEQKIVADPSAAMVVAGRFGHAWGADEVKPLAQLAGFLEQQNIHEVWIAAPWEDKTLLQDSLDHLKELVVDVNVVPDLHQYRLLNQDIIEWGGMPVINLAGTPMTGAEMRLKNVLDWLGSLVLIVLLSPLLLSLAVAVRLSGPGPVLFHQKRSGIGGETIDILKFRSMRIHTEHEGQVVQATPDDDRVTPIGRFLRRSSLDELPQLFNVLRGEMSLVGPRPHAVEHNEIYKKRIPKYMLRHKVKPGMTGWAQVNGYRGMTETEEKMALRIEHDLWYIQNWSLWLDIRILLQTPIALLHSNAF